MRRLAPILVAALALALAACNGDDAPSQEDYAQDAERICRDAFTRLEELGSDAETPQDIAEAIDSVIAETRRTIDELEALERPDGDAGETAGDFVAAVRSDANDEAIPALQDLRTALEDRDEQAARDAAERLQSLDASRSDRLARELGATECAE
jgi:hypothetical protein